MASSFRYYTQAAPITVEQKKGHLPTVWIPVVCDSVTVDSSGLRSAPPDAESEMDKLSEAVDP